MSRLRICVPLLAALAYLSPIFSAPSLNCPASLPSTCSCTTTSSSRLSVTCNGGSLAAILKELGNSPIERLHVGNCSESRLDRLPAGPVRSLHITNCNVKTVDAAAFKKQSNDLEQLVLSHNALTTIPKLGNLSRLIDLNLNYNQISSVEKGALFDLERLAYLRLEGNNICSLNGSAFEETKERLQLLDLSDNCLKAVPAQNLRNANRLAYLDLSGNNISEINNFELMNLPSLKELRLQNNFLHHINQMAFFNVPNLESLYLSNNMISSLDGNRLQAFKKLKVLDVGQNMLQSVPELKDMPLLDHVLLDGNLIERINTLAFSNNTKLQLIDLANNNIQLISRNSFDSLQSLTVLVLANNSISKLDKGMLDGIPHLEMLSLRNNSLTEVAATAFSSLPDLQALDLAYNKLPVLRKGTLDKQTKLNWLDLSNNKLKVFENGCFKQKITNILLDGNPLNCDNRVDWLVDYLVKNEVRTFLPDQKEVKCSAPSKFAGTSLKDLMLKKMETGYKDAMNMMGYKTDNQQNQASRSLLQALLPAFSPLGSVSGGQAAAAGSYPLVSTLTRSMPILSGIPGMQQVADGIDGQTMLRDGGVSAGSVDSSLGIDPQFSQAIEQLTGPLVRMSTGGEASPYELEQLIKSIPNFVVNVPGFGNVDLKELPPDFLKEVLRTGQVPFLPKEISDKVVRQAMQRMYEAAERARQGDPLPDQDKYLPPIDKVPEDVLKKVVSGQQLPYLNQSQTNTIFEHYTKQLPTAKEIPPSLINALAAAHGKQALQPKADNQTFGQLFQIWQMLPAGYNLTNIPQEIITALMSGKVPDLTKLPKDLLEHFKANGDKMVALFNQVKTNNVSLEEVLSKLPTFERPELSTFSPYDINKLTNDMIQEEEVARKNKQMRMYTAIALGLVGAVTIAVLIAFAIYFKRHRQQKTSSQGSLITGVSSGSGGSASMNESAAGRQVAAREQSNVQMTSSNNGTRPSLPSECLFTEPPGLPLFNSTMKADDPFFGLVSCPSSASHRHHSKS